VSGAWVTALGVVTVVLAVAGCDSGSARAPSGLVLAAASDSTVLLTWVEPAAGTPDASQIYFRAAGTELFSLIAETTGMAYIHEPEGTTGTYRVSARWGSETYECERIVTTLPVSSDTVAVAELNAAGNSGYGWNRETGRYRTCSMRDHASRTLADFYVTDFKPAGLNELPYSLASPEMGPADPGEVVPFDTWQRSQLTDPLMDELGPVPSIREPLYYDYADITRDPCYVGCFTADSHYALIKVVEVDSANRWVRLVSWFQLVRNLRLIRH
jgi:hypothetical protein